MIILAPLAASRPDVFLFSKLPEADQRAILRQANKQEFERYVHPPQTKIRAQGREERAGIRSAVLIPIVISTVRRAVHRDGD